MIGFDFYRNMSKLVSIPRVATSIFPCALSLKEQPLPFPYERIRSILDQILSSLYYRQLLIKEQIDGALLRKKITELMKKANDCEERVNMGIDGQLEANRRHEVNSLLSNHDITKPETPTQKTSLPWISFFTFFDIASR